MLVEITYACKMNCSHCMSDCKPDGMSMSLATLEDTLKFMVKHRIPTWSFSGGEMFEHPEIMDVLKLIETYWQKSIVKCPISFITNGRELVRNKEIYNAVSDLQKKYSKRNILIQVTDDERFYPDPLTSKEKYWLGKLNAIIEPVPSNPMDKSKCLYPQGRALINHPDSNWNTIGPKCANCILITKQKPNITFNGLVNTLLSHGKTCTPVVAPDGSIKIGESALCPSVTSIYDTESDIIHKISQCKCHACKIPWERFKKTNPLAYSMLA